MTVEVSNTAERRRSTRLHLLIFRDQEPPLLNVIAFNCPVEAVVAHRIPLWDGFDHRISEHAQLRANGSREGAPDDRLRGSNPETKAGLLPPPGCRMAPAGLDTAATAARTTRAVIPRGSLSVEKTHLTGSLPKRFIVAKSALFCHKPGLHRPAHKRAAVAMTLRVYRLSRKP